MGYAKKPFKLSAMYSIIHKNRKLKINKILTKKREKRTYFSFNKTPWWGFGSPAYEKRLLQTFERSKDVWKNNFT